MKREYLSGCTPTLSIPFQENLIFHAPLINDTKDYISNTEVTVTSPATLSFNSTKNMYLFEALLESSSLYKTLFYWNTPSLGLINNNTLVSDIHCTVYYKVIFVQYSYNSRCIPGLTYIKGYRQYGFVATSDIGVWNYNFLTNVPYNVAIIIDGATEKVYVNSQNISTRASQLTMRSMNKSELDYGIKVFAVHHETASSHGGSEYLQDIRLYNRALSDSEVTQL